MMIEPREPLYQWGQRVVALVEMLNDGTYPERAVDEMLVDIGEEGEIVQVGHHEETNQPIYMVEFGALVVGCFEEELMLAAELQTMAAEAKGQTALPWSEATA
jgi:nitrogen fixation protein NifZ